MAQGNTPLLCNCPATMPGFFYPLQISQNYSRLFDMPGAALLASRRAAKARPITVEARVCWQRVGQPKDGYLILIPDGLGLKPGDQVKVTLEKIENKA